MINIKDFDSSLLEKDKKLYKNIGLTTLDSLQLKNIDG